MSLFIVFLAALAPITFPRRPSVDQRVCIMGQVYACVATNISHFCFEARNTLLRMKTQVRCSGKQSGFTVKKVVFTLMERIVASLLASGKSFECCKSMTYSTGSPRSALVFDLRTYGMSWIYLENH